MTELALWIRSVWRHWKVLATGPLLSLGTSLFEHFRQTSISWAWYVALVFCPFPVAFFFGWRDEHRRAIEAENERDEAIDKDRPEVFVTLSFGRDGVRLVGVQNCGVRDARNVQIKTLHLNGVNLTLDVYGHTLDWKSNVEAAQRLGDELAKAVADAEANSENSDCLTAIKSKRLPLSRSGSPLES